MIMEIATVVFLGVWLLFFCLVAYKQLNKEFKPYSKDENGGDK